MKNEGYALRDLILYGKYYRYEHWFWVEPLSVDMIQYWLDNYIEPTEAAKMSNNPRKTNKYIKEALRKDSNKDDE